MTRDSLQQAFLLPEDLVDVFGDPLHDLEEHVLPGRLIVGGRGLHHMARAV